MNNNIIILIGVTILVFIFIAIYKVVKAYLINPIMKDKDPTLNTPLNSFRESSRYDTIIKNSNKNVVVSISQLFEEMCVHNPDVYENYSSLPKIIKDYKDLLKGKILDPEAMHAPSEYLEGISNSDYGIYLKAQARSLQRAGKDVMWFKNELKRFSKCEKEELFEADFMINLEKMGAPSHLISSLVNEHRMEKFTPDDWKELIVKVKEYDEVYSDVDVSYFLELIEDKGILLDEAKMEAFHLLRKLNIEEELAAAYIKNDLSSEDICEVSSIMDKYNMSCVDALSKFLASKKLALKKANLKDHYKRQIISN